MSDKDRRGAVNQTPGTGGPAVSYSVTPEVPFFRQRHINECQDKCLHMVIAYHRRLPELTIAHGGRIPDQILTGKDRGRFAGLPEEQFNTLAGQAGMTVNNLAPSGGEGAKWDARSLAAALQQGPIICSLDFRPKVFGSRVDTHRGHTVVLAGVDESGVIFHDPWEGKNRKISLDKFNNTLRPHPNNMRQLVPNTTNTPTTVTPAVAETSSDVGKNNLTKFVKRVQFQSGEAAGRSSSSATAVREPAQHELIGPIEELANAGIFGRRDDTMVDWAACASKDPTLVATIRIHYERLSRIGTKNAEDVRDLRLMLYENVRKELQKGAPVTQMQQLFSRFRDEVQTRQKEVSDLQKKLQKACVDLLSKYDDVSGEPIYEMVARICPEAIPDFRLKREMDKHGKTVALKPSYVLVGSSTAVFETNGAILRDS